MVFNTLLSLLWTRWLLRAFGQETYGLYMTFLGVLGLASAGELGMGGAVVIRTGRLLAEDRLEELRHFHGTARRAFQRVAIGGGLLFLLLSPWLPQWLHFRPAPGAGSLPLLFAAGAGSVAITIYGSYLAGATYAVGTVLWPILPSFVFTHAVFASQVGLGFAGAPLWLVQTAVFALNLASLGAGLLIYRRSHPIYAERLTYSRQNAAWRDLTATSVWCYLFGLATIVYTSTDRLIVNAFLGASVVPILQLNGRLVELGATFIVTISAVASPRLVLALLSPDAAARSQGRAESWKVARFQGGLGIAGGLLYLWVNDFFVARLFGPAVRGPLDLQAAYAVSLVLTAYSDIYLQLAGRLHENGIRFAAQCVVCGGICNLGFTYFAASHWHWLDGVVWATCSAQLITLFGTSIYVLRNQSEHSLARLIGFSFLWPMALLSAAIWLRAWLHPVSAAEHLELAAFYLLLLGAQVAVAGPRPAEVYTEARLVLRRFGLGRAPAAA